jgi:hypothetical protein
VPHTVYFACFDDLVLETYLEYPLCANAPSVPM